MGTGRAERRTTTEGDVMGDGMLLALAIRLVADTGAPQSPLDFFTQYGVLGAVVTALIIGWLVPGWYVKQVTEENKRLTKLIEESVIPMNSSYAEVIKQNAEALNRQADALEKNAAVEEAKLRGDFTTRGERG